MFGVTAALILSGAANAAVGSPIDYAHYRDEFLAVDVPPDSKQASDGSYRVVRNGKTLRYEFLASTPHVNDRRVNCQGLKPTYHVSKASLFAYSCIVGQRVIYHIEKYGRTYRVGASNATETIELTMTYPASQQAYWGPVVTHMSQSLQFPSRTRTPPHG